MSAAILFPPAFLRRPFGKSIALHIALGSVGVCSALWTPLSSRESNQDSPLFLEISARPPARKTGVTPSPRVRFSEAVAKETSSQAVSVSPIDSTSSENSEEALGSARTTYLSELRSFIERHKSYPPQARTLGHEGQAKVRFSIMSDGTLSSIELLGSSGSQILDHAALSLLQRVQKLSPIPVDLKITRLDLILPIEYSLN